LSSWPRSRTFMEVQLAFPFLDAPEGAPPVVSRYRRRLMRVAGQAYRLGVIRTAAKHLSEPPAGSLSAAVVVPVPSRGPAARYARPAYLTTNERHAVEQVARRLQRLAPSHRDPERYHVEKDSICRALRDISRR
jgi:hypothetical protein